MNYYRQYMDRQTLSPEFLERLGRMRPRPRSHWGPWAALAACCVLLAGVGSWAMTRPPEAAPVEPPQAVGDTLPSKGKKSLLPQLAFQDNGPDHALDRATEDAAAAPPLGALEYQRVDQTGVAALFGGEIPDLLGWGDFTVTSSAGEPGSPYLYVSGQAEDFAFDLAVQEGEIPDLAAGGGEITLFCGVEIAGVKQAEDLYEISFMTPEGLGVFYRVKGGDGPARTAALAWALLAREGA